MIQQRFATLDKVEDQGALMNRPPTKQLRDIFTRMVRSPNILSAVTFYYCDISTL
jgi:hypothetical protein